jgi:chemotaxis protein MotA
MKNFRSLSQSFIISTILQATLMAAMSLIPPHLTMLRRICMVLGADFINGGYIQYLTFIAFFWGFFEIKEKIEKLGVERRAFTSGIIPLNEKHVFLSQDIANFKFKLVEADKKHKTLLTDLLKKVCFKFRSADSLGELMDLVSIQVSIYQEKSESEQSIIRYLNWVIPSLGFIGTVIGLSQSLMIANSGDMNKITMALAVAFDTTLVALILSTIIMWFFHEMQEKTDQLHSDIKEFVIENFINKIER